MRTIVHDLYEYGEASRLVSLQRYTNSIASLLSIGNEDTASIDTNGHAIDIGLQDGQPDTVIREYKELIAA